MKVWKSFSGEHSAKLRIVGQFKEAENLNSAKEVIELLTNEVMKQDVSRLTKAKCTDEILSILREKGLYDIGEEDLIHFTHAHNINYAEKTITINTDETDIQGLLKVLIRNSAKIQMYSKHDYPEN